MPIMRKSTHSSKSCTKNCINNGIQMPEIFEKPGGVKTCWASMENPECKKGGGGIANNGRKGSPCACLPAASSLVLAKAQGPGIVRRIWITFEKYKQPEILKQLKIKIYWDDCGHPAVSAPLGDFFCCNLGKTAPFENCFFSSPEGRSFNCYVDAFQKGHEDNRNQ